MKLRETARTKASAEYENYETLLEMEDDDEGLSASERALVAKADIDLKKRGVKVKNFDPDKIVGKGAKPKDEDDGEDETPAPKKKHAPEEKKGTLGLPKEKTGEAKSRGEKAAQARKFLQDHPNATRKEFTQFVANHGMGAAYANTMFYMLKKKLSEVFYITNEQGQVLAEGDVWTVFEDYKKRLQMFKSEWKAKSKTLKTGGKVKVSKM